MKNYNTVMSKLIKSEMEQNKCPYCWGTVVEKHNHNYCDDCKIKVEGDNYELI
jgi:ribosomal protein L37AE/L43A